MAALTAADIDDISRRHPEVFAGSSRKRLTALAGRRSASPPI